MKRVIFLFALLLTTQIIVANNVIGIIPFIEQGDTLNILKNNSSYEYFENLNNKEYSSKMTTTISFVKQTIDEVLSLNQDINISYLISQTNIENEISKEEELKSSLLEKISLNNYSSLNKDSINNQIAKTEQKIINLQNFQRKLNNEEFSSKKEIETFLKNGDLNKIDFELPYFKIFYPTYLQTLLLSQSSWSLNDYKRLNNIDSVIFVKLNKIGEYDNLTLYFQQDSKKMVKIFDKIIINNLISSIKEDLLSSLIKTFYNNKSLLNINSNTSGLKISLVEDSSSIKDKFINDKIYNLNEINFNTLQLVEIPFKNPFLILPKKENILLITAYKKEPYIVKLNTKEDIVEINIENRDKTFNPLILNSNIGKVFWNINGKDFKESISLKIDKMQIPSIISATKEGFSPLLFQYNKEKNILNFDLKPSFLQNNTIIEDKQDEFYKSLLSYIFTCASFISINTINNIYGEKSIKPVISTLSTGFITIASFNIAYELISYIKLATK